MKRGEGARAQALACEHVNVARMNLENALDRPEQASQVMPAMRLFVSAA